MLFFHSEGESIITMKRRLIWAKAKSPKRSNEVWTWVEDSLQVQKCIGPTKISLVWPTLQKADAQIQSYTTHLDQPKQGIVVEKVGIEAKQPNSGIRKVVKIYPSRTEQVNRFRSRWWRYQLHHHDEVMVEGIGGRMGRSYGDIPGVRYKVIQVNGVSLDEMVRGRRRSCSLRC